MADKVEEAVGRAGMSHSLNDIQQSFGGSIVNEGTDIHSWDRVNLSSHVCESGERTIETRSVVVDVE